MYVSDGREPRVVDEQIDGEVTFLNLAGKSGDLVAVGEIARKRFHPDSMVALELRRKVAKPLLPACDEKEAVSARGELARKLLADSARGTGDEAGRIGSWRR